MLSTEAQQQTLHLCSRWSSNAPLSAPPPRLLFLRRRPETRGFSTDAARSKTCPRKGPPRSARPPGSTTWRSFCSRTRQRKASTAPSQRKLFQAGGPVLFVPHIFRGTFKAKRIGVCWDGSRLAARALRDARPFLCQADALVAISINGAETTPPDATPEELARHLARVELPLRISTYRQRAPKSSLRSFRSPPMKVSICWSWELTGTPAYRKGSSAGSRVKCSRR